MGEHTGLVESPGICDQFTCRIHLFALHPVPAHGVHRLR